MHKQRTETTQIVVQISRKSHVIIHKIKHLKADKTKEKGHGLSGGNHLFDGNSPKKEAVYQTVTRQMMYRRERKTYI